jgi:hypothetical protein
LLKRKIGWTGKNRRARPHNSSSNDSRKVNPPVDGLGGVLDGTSGRMREDRTSVAVAPHLHRRHGKMDCDLYVRDRRNSRDHRGSTSYRMKQPSEPAIGRSRMSTITRMIRLNSKRPHESEKQRYCSNHPSCECRMI